MGDVPLPSLPENPSPGFSLSLWSLREPSRPSGQLPPTAQTALPGSPGALCAQPRSLRGSTGCFISQNGFYFSINTCACVCVKRARGAASPRPSPAVPGGLGGSRSPAGPRGARQRGPGSLGSAARTRVPGPPRAAACGSAGEGTGEREAVVRGPLALPPESLARACGPQHPAPSLPHVSLSP